MKKETMQVMNFITRERVYRFSNDCSESALAKFLYSYFSKRGVDSILASFEVRIDTRCCYKGYYATVLVFKSKDGKIRDVKMTLFNPDTGMIVRNGDGDALIQHTQKQNSHVEYESRPWGDKSYSLANELSKGYDLKKQPTLFGMQKINRAKRIGVVTSAVDAVVMSIIDPHCTWLAAGHEGKFGVALYHPNVIQDLRGTGVGVTLYPECDGEAEAEQIKENLLRNGIKADVYPHLDYLKNCEFVGHRKSISTIALKMIDMQFSYSDIMLALRLVNEQDILPPF